MIERSSDGLSFAQLGTVGANGTSYPDTGLIPGTTYYYRVRAYHSGLYSAYSDPASATTFAPPAAPSNLVATAASSSQINLTWTDNSSNEDGFKLYRSTDGVNYSNIKILAGNVTSFSDYQQVNGLKLPARITTKTDNYTTADIRLTKQNVDGDTGS